LKEEDIKKNGSSLPYKNGHPFCLTALNWLVEEKTTDYGDVLYRTLLQEGFVDQNHKITLLGAKGILKPKVIDLTLLQYLQPILYFHVGQACVKMKEIC
jgi:hypothetical protein